MMGSYISSKRLGFTLIELLIVIAIIAILAVVVILALNPAELLRQARDSNRLSDMNTLNQILNLALIDGLTLGPSNVVDVSVPDQALTGNVTSTCPNMSMPILPPTYNYQCVSPTNYKNIDSTGWIPVNFKQLSAGSPIGSLPTDPLNTNNTTTHNYYAYAANSTQWDITAPMEASKYKLA